MKFLALNVYFSSPSLDPLGLRKPAHASVKEGTYPSKSGHLFAVELSITWHWLQIDIDMLLIITSTGDELFRNVNIDDREPPKIVIPDFWLFLAVKK